jgi:erythromycin esterase
MNFTNEKKSVSRPDVKAQLKDCAHPLVNARDLDPLMELIGDSKYVLLGEASHGTHEYYNWRAAITRRLIAEKNFSFVAVEGDWPDCYRLNRYVKGYTHTASGAREMLQEFDRWPTWMWANWEMVAFAEWLHKHNKSLPAEMRVGFYGLDVYSLWESIDVLLEYMQHKDPKMLHLVRQVAECFHPYSRDEGSSYASATAAFSHTCEDEAVNLLSRIRERLPIYNTDPEAVLSAEQNAVVIKNAEDYYRNMIKGGAVTWNIRDRHMMDTLNRLMKFHGEEAKVIVWEHNTHIGDARATDMFEEGMVNIGQLAEEEHYKEGVVRVGFGSYEGSVIAAREWGEKMRRMQVPPAREGSWEHLLKQSVAGNQLFLSKDLEKIDIAYPLGHRAIGVVYNPEVERWGNYVPSLLPLRYEAFIYLEKSQALHPLHIMPDGHQMPETYPWGL